MNTQSHYPKHLQGCPSPYLQALAPSAERVATFEYRIGAQFERLHANPPIWQDFHPHQFSVVLRLRAVRGVSAMYGVDMVEQENLLKVFCDELPAVINQHPACPGGTTEELCLYFAQMRFADHIQLLQVEVSETPERVTVLRVG